MAMTSYVQRNSAPRDLTGALGSSQFYLNVIYLLLSLPLGVFYFAFLSAGLSAGAGLLAVWVGLPVLVVVFIASRALARAERQLANWLLDARIPDYRPPALPGLRHPWQSFKLLVSDRWTWSGLFFLFLKLPLGIVSLLPAVLIAVSVSLILVPLSFHYVPVSVGDWPIRTGDAALLCLAAGLIFGVISIYVVNGIAIAWRALAISFLGRGEASQQVPSRTGPIVIN